jgi:phosphonopyruvate decarboxylase
MLDSGEFLSELDNQGFGPFLGVPCSFLSPMINKIIDSPRLQFLPVNNEGEAAAVAFGMYLTGKKPVVMLQNSGLGNIINPVSSLLYTFKAPILLIITWRGEPGLPDAPQHELMGQITTKLLETVHIEKSLFPDQPVNIVSAIDEAIDYMNNTSLPYAFLLRKGSIAKYEVKNKTTILPMANKAKMIINSAKCPVKPMLTRRKLIARVLKIAKADCVVVATTGFAGRELFDCDDRPGNFYVVGSMGCASSIALGIALGEPERIIFILDGDGAALMRLEAMVSIGHYQPGKIIHIILDNKIYESTGGQPTLSNTVIFAELARSLGYESSCSIASEEQLTKRIRQCMEQKGPHFIHFPILPGTDPGLGRPHILPVTLKERLISFLKRGRIANKEGSERY